jgi:hypothetical protein
MQSSADGMAQFPLLPEGSAGPDKLRALEVRLVREVQVLT